MGKSHQFHINCGLVLLTAAGWRLNKATQRTRGNRPTAAELSSPPTSAVHQRVNETLASERPDILSRLYRRTTRSPVGALYQQWHSAAVKLRRHDEPSRGPGYG